MITENFPQLAQVYSLQTYYKAEAWILYGLDKTVQNEILGQSGYLTARAFMGLNMNNHNRHERKDICFQLLQQVDHQKVKFNTWMTRGDSRDHEHYPIQFKLD